MTNDELVKLREQVEVHRPHTLVPILRERIIDIINELITTRLAMTTGRDQHLKTVQALNDILRRQVVHYRDRHIYPVDACPDCGD